MRTIVVGVDGSANGRAAFDWAVSVGETTGARVLVVHARGLLDGHVVPEFPEVPESGDCRCVTGDGSPAEVLVRVADQHDADLIVVGRRGSSGVSGLTLGSTSLRLVQEATRPVAVIP